MHPVNIQLNVSGAQQLKFLEEIISLLHVHQDARGSNNRELDSGLPVRVTSPATGTQLPHMHSPFVSEEGMQGASSAEMDTARKDLTTPPLGSFIDSAPQSHHNHQTSFSKFGDGSSIYPHPPASPPPQSALSAMKFRRMARSQPQKHSSEFELSPHHYLNEAELALIYSQQPLLFAQSNMDAQPPAMPWSRSSAEVEHKRREAPLTCRSDYWLKDSSEQRLQDWLLKKDKECLLQRRNDLKQRRLKCKEREAKAIQKIEKAKRAKLAYRTWLDRKREEDKRVIAKRSISVQPIPLRGSMAQSKIQPQRPSAVQPAPSIVRRPVKSFMQKHKHVPLKDQQQNDSTSSISKSKRLTFKEWVQMKERDRKSMNISSKDLWEGQVPEDLQKIARGMRTLRLQQKDCSKKRVDSGVKKHRVTASSKDSKSALQPKPDTKHNKVVLQ